jgi:hypothetical protein
MAYTRKFEPQKTAVAGAYFGLSECMFSGMFGVRVELSAIIYRNVANNSLGSCQAEQRRDWNQPQGLLSAEKGQSKGTCPEVTVMLKEFLMISRQKRLTGLTSSNFRRRSFSRTA